jgi:hypothetical protein
MTTTAVKRKHERNIGQLSNDTGKPVKFKTSSPAPMLLLSVVLMFCGCGYSDYQAYSGKAVADDKLNKGYWGRFPAHRVTKDGFYSIHSSSFTRNTFDLYRPVDVSEPLPLLIFIHQGAFLCGDKSDYIISQLCQDFCRTGRYATASVNYRILEGVSKVNLLSKSLTRKKIFEAVGDVKCAVAHFKDNSHIYQIDPDNIFVIGYSAGGIIVNQMLFSSTKEAKEYIKEGRSLLAINPTWTDIDNTNCLDLDINKMVKGLVSIAGGVLDHDHIEDVDIAQTPLLLIHGNKDDIVPFGRGNPLMKYAQSPRIALAEFYYDIGIRKKNQSGRTNSTQEEVSVELGIKIPESWLKTAIEAMTSPVCGSGCIKDRLRDTKKLKLIVINQAPHVFMLSEDGRFNQSYVDTRNWIDGFVRGEMR